MAGLGGLENAIQCRAVLFQTWIHRGFGSQKRLGLIWEEQTCFYHGLVLEGMGAQILNLLLHTGGLEPEQILKLFPLSVKQDSIICFCSPGLQKKVVLVPFSLVTAPSWAWCSPAFLRAVFWLQLAAVSERLVRVSVRKKPLIQSCLFCNGAQ